MTNITIAGSEFLKDVTGVSTERPVSARPRVEWLDRARGIGILFVVMGHALGGIIDSPLGAGLENYRLAFLAIYTFHMPLFFMLSGLLVADRLDRNRAGFGRSLITNIAWPYFLWSVIQFTIIYQLSSLVNAPPDHYWATIARLPLHSVSQFWFLYALFVLHLMAFLLLRPLGPIGFLLFGLALKPFAEVVPLPEVLRYAANQAPYYAIGVGLGVPMLARVFVERTAAIRVALVPMLAIIVVALTVMSVSHLDPSMSFVTRPAAGLANLAWRYQAMAAALLASGAVIGIGASVSGKAGEILEYLGKRSMPIFILHILAIAGTRIAMSKFLHIGSADAILITSIVIGIAMPLIADRIVQRLGLSTLIGLK